jgi:hypothetical protein
MRKKYDYFVNNKKMSKKKFMEELKKCCYKVVRTDVIAGWCGVDFSEFDEKKFNSEMYAINNGTVVMCLGHQKTFSRKEVRV